MSKPTDASTRWTARERPSAERVLGLPNRNQPLEHGRGTTELASGPRFTVNAEYFLDLADQLGSCGGSFFCA